MRERCLQRRRDGPGVRARRWPPPRWCPPRWAPRATASVRRPTCDADRRTWCRCSGISEGFTTSWARPGCSPAPFGLLSVAVLLMFVPGSVPATTVTSNTTVTELLAGTVMPETFTMPLPLAPAGAARKRAGGAGRNGHEAAERHVVGHIVGQRHIDGLPARALGERDGVAQRVARRGLAAVEIEHGLGRRREVRVERRGRRRSPCCWT